MAAHLNAAAALAAVAWLAGAPLAADAAEPANAALVFVPAPQVRLTPAALAALCATLPTPCAAPTTTAYATRGAPSGPLYLIDSAGPLLVRLGAAQPASASGATTWDFSTHEHSAPVAGEPGRASEPLRLHPALYPAGAGAFAVALVSDSREMYSGGGASFEVADFVRLDAAPGNPRGSWSTLYAAVPFACSKLIRACFTERDYKTSRHCHDEYDGHLTIDHAATGAWRFVWHETEWPSNVSATRKYSTREPFAARPGPAASVPAALPKAAAFCGGPV